MTGGTVETGEVVLLPVGVVTGAVILVGPVVPDPPWSPIVATKAVVVGEAVVVFAVVVVVSVVVLVSVGDVGDDVPVVALCAQHPSVKSRLRRAA